MIAVCTSEAAVLHKFVIGGLTGGANHTGKQPKFMAGGRKTAFKDGTMEFSAEEEIKQLEHRLKAALRMEEYEEAALCRDRLKLLREGVKNNDEVV